MGLPDPRASEAAPPSPSNIFHRSLSKAYPTATKGAGVYLISADGRRILDGSSGAAVSCLGHGHEKVIEAIVDQARQLAFAHTSFFTNDPAEELASLLVESSHGAFSKVMFLSSGTCSPPSLPLSPSLMSSDVSISTAAYFDCSRRVGGQIR